MKRKLNFICFNAITINQFFLDTLKILSKEYDIEIFATNCEKIKNNNIKKTNLKLSKNYSNYLNILYLFKSLLILRKLIKYKKNEIFYTNTPFISALFRIASIGINSKIVYHVHGFRFHKKSNKIKYILFFLIEYILKFKTNAFIVINNEDEQIVKKYFKKNYLKINGIGITYRMDLKSFKKINKERNIDDLKIIVISAYRKNKGYDKIIIIAEQLQKLNLDIHIDCFGYGDKKKYLNLISKKNLKNIQLNDFDDKLTDKIINYDLMLHTSYREGLPVSVMQCLNCGIPVFGFNIRGMNDLIKKNYNGNLYEINEEKKIVNEIAALYHDRKTLNFLKSNSFKSLDESYNNNYVTKQLIKFLNKIYEI